MDSGEATQFRAFDDQWINVKQLNVREQASSVFLAEFWIGVFVRIGVSANEASVEQTATGSRVGHGQWNSTQGPLVVFNGLTFGLVVHSPFEWLSEG